ncbi:helix-turn-helix domain-containing protein [Anatilimnocola floriformis]|uniref:helix-turn-helix domain-containing protein n=1 Tax=Anatilimnocola floriformis TaxID=2948575 RepID=UPI0036F3DE80
MAKVTEQLRAHLIARGDSQNRIHKQTGLSRKTVADFLSGENIRGETLDTLCEYVGAVLTLPPLPKEPGKKAKPAKGSG